MTTIKKSIVIEGDPVAINALASHNDRLPEWYAGVIAVEPEPGYPQQIGTKAQLTYKAAGVTFKTTLTSLEYESGKHSLFKLEGMIAGTN